MNTIYDTDVLIIGSEGAGTRAAIAAAKQGASVLIVTKGRIGKSGATLMAAADISVDGASIFDVLGLSVGNSKDSPQIFLEDILRAGKFINNLPLAEKIVEAAPIRVKEMMAWGMKIRGVMQCPGHRYPRGVSTTGREIVRVLNKQLRSVDLTVKEYTFVIDLLTTGNSVIGAIGLDLRTGEFAVFRARAVILATGGGSMLYPIQTGAVELTGDGYAMALRAGARLVDFEMIQFMPLCLIGPLPYRGSYFPFSLVAESVDSLDGWLLNRRGERFMRRWDPELLEKTTRDKLSAAIGYEVKHGRGTPNGGIYLSLAHLPRNILDDFANRTLKLHLKKNWRFEGFDFSFIRDILSRGEALEVGPACHFFVGGIDVDLDCQTSLPGLFAAGEVVGGLHGANRLSGNACMEILVAGEMAGRKAAEYAKQANGSVVDQSQIDEIVTEAQAPLERKGSHTTFMVKKKIQERAWGKVGPIRDGQELEGALASLKELTHEHHQSGLTCKDRVYNPEWIQVLQNRNLLILLEAIIQCALAREESRGVHYRIDWPQQIEKWRCNLVVELTASGLEIYPRNPIE
ncbi:MAG: FAD-binding protein [Deltaproteobacteria bacterium]|nr:MAG: FAD-binding protein [Deltaproteobacteria bacterium]